MPCVIRLKKQLSSILDTATDNDGKVLAPASIDPFPPFPPSPLSPFCLSASHMPIPGSR